LIFILDAISANTTFSSHHACTGSTITHAEERITRRKQHPTEVSLTTTFLQATDTAGIGQNPITCTVFSENNSYWDDADVAADVCDGTANYAKRISGFGGDRFPS
jgi:hypothetical protein